jgi:hypothetical protein
MEASSGVEPLSVRLEGASPKSLGEAESGADRGSQTRPEFVGNDFPHLAVIRMIGCFEWNRTTRLRFIGPPLYH